MPARTTGAPGRFPARLAWFGALPQDEIQGIFLDLVHFDAGTDLQLVDLSPRQLAVALELAHPVVDVAIAGRVGEALVDQGLDHLVHAGDMAGGTRLDVRTQNREARLVLVHRSDHALHQRFERLAVLVGATDDLVVDIGDVAHVGEVIAAMAQPARHHVEGHHHPRMADMAEVIDGHAADIHAHLVADQRLQGLLGLAQGVVDRQRHHWPQESRRVTVRLNTGLPGCESFRSATK
ncbi:hypothetical protein D9M68_708030 [compost metagenome]